MCVKLNYKEKEEIMRIRIILFLCLMFAVCAFGLSACKEDNKEHIHNFVYTTVKESNCETDGLLLGVCSCGETNEIIRPTKGHSFGEANCLQGRTC